MDEIELSTFKIQYSKRLPRATILDFDYGVGERFPITYNNTIKIIDKITGIEAVSVTVSDDTIRDIVCALAQVSDNIYLDNSNEEMRCYSHITILASPCYRYNYNCALFINVSKDINNSSGIILSFIFQNELMETDTFSLPLTDMQTQELYFLLDDTYGYGVAVDY